MRLSGGLLFENTRKNFKPNLVLVVVLVLESKSLYCQFANQHERKFETDFR